MQHPTSTPPGLIRSRLKMRQALLLVSLANEPNLHRAAESLAMTQPAASRLLKELEDLLRVPLFERLPRGMKPTHYGEILIRHARAIVSSMAQAQEEIDGLRNGLMGEVRLGVIMGPGATLVPQVIARLHHLAPKVRVSVVMDVSDSLHGLLNAGRLDILVARLLKNPGECAVNYQQLARESISVVARPGHPLIQAQGLTLADLATSRWILPPVGSVLRPQFDLLYRQAGLEPPENTVETVALPVITSLLEQTDMLAAIGTEVAQHYARHGIVEFLPINIHCNLEPFGLITARDRLLLPSAQMMLELLREEAAVLYGCVA